VNYTKLTLLVISLSYFYPSVSYSSTPLPLFATEVDKDLPKPLEFSEILALLEQSPWYFKKAPTYARRPNAEEIGKSFTTWIVKDGKLVAETKNNKLVKNDDVIARNEDPLTILNEKDEKVYNEWVINGTKFEELYGSLPMTSKVSKPYYKIVGNQMVEVNQDILDILGLQSGEDIWVDWGKMAIYNDSFLTDAGYTINGEHINTYEIAGEDVESKIQENKLKNLNNVADDINENDESKFIDVASEFSNAIEELIIENDSLNGDMVPVIGSIKRVAGDGANREIEVSFVNVDTNEIVVVQTEDESILEFKEMMEENISDLGSLNVAFSIIQVINYFDEARKTNVDSQIHNNLYRAVKAHEYLYDIQMGTGVVASINEFVRIFSDIEMIASPATVAFTSVFGIEFAAGVIMDAFQIHYAQTDRQKAVFGSQLFFDSTFLVTSVASLIPGVAASLGFEAVSLVGTSMVSGFLVPLAGLGQGIISLANAYGGVSDDAKSVGLYFDSVDKAYQQGYYLDSESQVWLPSPGAVISKIDLDSEKLSYDSQYIYSTGNSTHCHQSDNWIKSQNAPYMIHDRSKAINVRHSMNGVDSDAPIGLPVRHQPLYLPYTPKSYISYNWNMLPFAFAKHDKGFSILRDIENRKQRDFCFDYYIWPSEKIMQSITQEYVSTHIKVVLDGIDRTLIMPDYLSTAGLKTMKGYITYELQGLGGNYSIIANKGASLSLVGNNSMSNWFINFGKQNISDLEFNAKGFNINGINVEINNRDEFFDSILLMNVLVFSFLCRALSWSVKGVLLAQANHKLLAPANLLSALINILCSIIFSQYMGIIGIAVGTAIGFFISDVLLNLIQLKRYNDFNIFPVIRAFILSVLLTYSVGYLGKEFIIQHLEQSWLMLVASGIVIFPFILLANWLVLFDKNLKRKSFNFIGSKLPFLKTT